MELKNVPTSDKIQPVEIETVMLNTQVITPFCVSWSEDNKVSIIVEGGVFIFELWPTPMTEQQGITFLKSWIPASTSLPLSHAVVQERNEAFLWNLERKNAFETTLDPTLSAVVQKPNLSSAFSHVIQCDFSPITNDESYISVLTNNGCLEIYKKDLKKLSLVINVTNLWISFSRKESSAKEITFDYFKSKMLELKIIAMKWCSKPELLFITCHEDGGVVVWNVCVQSCTMEMSVKYCFHIDGKPCCVETTSVPDSSYVALIMGTSSGAVKFVLLNLKNGETKQSFDLWKDNDFISPSVIKIKSVGSKLYVFIVKRHILLIQDLSLNDFNNCKVLNTKWQEFPTTIVSLNEYQDDLLIALQNHEVYALTITNDLEYDLKLIDMGVKAKHKTCHHCYGMALSSNKIIWVLVSSPKVNYDQLKEITHLMFYTPKIKIYKNITHTSSCGLIAAISSTCENTRLHQIFDILELKKIEMLTDATKIKEEYEIDVNASLLSLQLLLWEVKLKMYCNIELSTAAAEIEAAIARKRAEKIVLDSQNSDSLTESKVRSLNVCLSLLNMEDTNDYSSVSECAMCGNKAFFEDLRISSCVNEHKFPRCCLSFLPCDIVPYALCSVCDSVALPEFVTENDNRCTYCDGLLEFDTRLRRRC